MCVSHFDFLDNPQLLLTNMYKKTAFISGHTDLTQEEFDKHYAPVLKKMAWDYYYYVTAAALGADRMAMEYLVNKCGVLPRRITIYLHDNYKDREEGYSEDGYRVYAGYNTHHERDEAMTKASSVDVAWLRPDEEARAMYGSDWKKDAMSATERNILRREEILSQATLATERMKRRITPICAELPTNETTFVCSGIVPFDEPIGIYYQSKDGQTRYSELPIKDPQELNRLMEACETASFGVGKQEVVDETYRKALKLDTSVFATSFQISGTVIPNMVHKLLVPEASSIRLELYKLNIYGKGGFFKAHKDTPRGKGMFGSLVLCLDQPFTGGSFLVQHNGRVHEFDDSTREPGCLQWIGFFSDCTHEVKPVLDGCRVTLTYNLYRESDADKTVRPSICVGLLEAVRKFLMDGKFTGALGFPLEHVYVPGSTAFKGNDLLVFDTLLKIASEMQHDKVSVLPYLYAYDVEETDNYNNDYEGKDEDDELFINWSSFSTCDDLYERSANANWYKEAYGAKSYNVVWVKKPRSKQYKDNVAAYGNEPSTTDIYCGGCILMHVS